MEGFQDDHPLEYDYANPEEETESMNLTAVDCDMLKKYINQRKLTKDL